MTSTVSVFHVDRATCLSRLVLVDTITGYLKQYAVVQIEDGSRPRNMRFCYEVRPSEAALRLCDARGQQVGLFTDVAALVSHAEAMTS